MPFAEFQPSTIGSATSAVAPDSANAWSSMFQRAQQIAQSRAQFPLLQQQLAGQIALNSQSQEMNVLAIKKQLAQAALIPASIDAQSAQLDADTATAHATILAKNAEAQMTKAAMDDFPNVMGALNSITGGGPSTDPVSADVAPAADSDPVSAAVSAVSAAGGLPPAAAAVSAARAAGGLPPAAGATPAAPVAAPSINYTSVTKAVNAANIFKTRYGNLPGAAPILAQIDAKVATISNAYNSQLLSQMPSYQATINGATTTDQLRSLGADPDYNHAATIYPPLKQAYDQTYTTLQQKEQQDRQIKAEQENNQKRLDQEKNQHAADIQRQTLIDPGTGYTGNARSEAAATQFSSDAADFNNVAPKIQELLKISDMGQGAKLDLATKARAGVIATELLGNLKGPMIGGKLTNTDIKIMDGIISNPTNVTSIPSVTKASLRQVLSDAQADIDRKAASQGLKKVPAAPVAAKDAAQANFK